MLSSAIARAWQTERPGDKIIRLTREDADLTNAADARRALANAQPDLLIHAAAKVGGIAANVADPAGFLMDNLLIDTSVLRAATDLGVRDLVYVGSSCMYPKDYRQPLVETDILAAPLEPTNEGYAIAKIAAAKYCEYASQQFGLNYRVIVPSNLYGPGDDYATGRSHLVAAAIAKTHAAKIAGAGSVEVWGDGTARREFTFVDDVARWLATATGDMAEWPAMLNVGAGRDHTVLEIHQIAARVTGWEGEFELQPERPAGMRQKLMDSGEAKKRGWRPTTSLENGMRIAYEAFLAREAEQQQEGTRV
ncbi:GDP-L-fucose synthase [Diaminobutyricimonas aerilata]|uniref:GDP-L-fucose synthase n=2 Tax=Diaminobutyricimonas aerilata TaxID=1162967 RepID=A0A2M9CH32_9MICO|nr:GDP-L-fucose synthase [Diaminobutyricimonas aerilata]